VLVREMSLGVVCLSSTPGREVEADFSEILDDGMALWRAVGF